MKHQGTEILLQLSLVMASWKVAVWEGWNTSQILGQGVLSNFWMFISISESCVPTFARRGIWSFIDSLRCTFSSLRVKRHLEKSQQLGSYVQVPSQLFFFFSKPNPCPHSHFFLPRHWDFYEAPLFLSIFRSLRGYPESAEPGLSSTAFQIPPDNPSLYLEAPYVIWI